MSRKLVAVLAMAVVVLGAILWYQYYESNLIRRVEGIEGTGDSAVTSRFGEPDSDCVFLLTDPVYEYRRGLHKFYPDAQN